MIDPASGSLYAQAVDAMSTAYAPYSRFSVGAALLASDGTVVTGANVENASNGLGICAERVAVCCAVTQGLRKFVAIAVAAPADTVPPCGACLQVLSEFAGDDMKVIYRQDGDVVERRFSELMPARFEFDQDQDRKQGQDQ